MALDTLGPVMTPLLAAADAAASTGVDWGAIAVPVVSGAALIAVAIVNTRGETSALRRLKGMNEVLEKLPPGDQVTADFTVARNLMASRVAERVSRPSVWIRVIVYFGAVTIGLALVAAILWLSTVLEPSSSTPSDNGIALVAAVTGGLTAVLSLFAGFRSGRALRRIRSARRSTGEE